MPDPKDTLFSGALLSEADRIAADFAANPFADHEARKLAFAYLRLRKVEEAARTFLDLHDANAVVEPDPWVVLDWLAENAPGALELCPYKVVRRTVPALGIPQLREALAAL